MSPSWWCDPGLWLVWSSLALAWFCCWLLCLVCKSNGMVWGLVSHGCVDGFVWLCCCCGADSTPMQFGVCDVCVPAAHVVDMFWFLKVTFIRLPFTWLVKLAPPCCLFDLWLKIMKDIFFHIGEICPFLKDYSMMNLDQCTSLSSLRVIFF